MNIRLLKKMRRRRRHFRLSIMLGMLVAGMMLLYSVSLLLDPSASIIYNGVSTTAFNEKLFAALVPCVVLVALFGFLLVPDRALDRTFIKRQHTLSALSSWLRSV